METWDLIIIGAGAAGLAAGIYGSRSGLKTLILDEKLAGGTTADAPIVENYPGFPFVTGAELADKKVSHAKKTGAIIHELETVLSLDLKGEKKIVKTSRAEYEAPAIIIASGAHYREADVKGEKEFRGRGVSYCGVCDGPFFKGKRVLVIGGRQLGVHNYPVPFRLSRAGLCCPPQRCFPSRKCAGEGFGV